MRHDVYNKYENEAWNHREPTFQRDILHLVFWKMSGEIKFEFDGSKYKSKYD